MIEGVKNIPLKVNVDDRGYLIEVIRTSGIEPHAVAHQINQVYLVGNQARGTIRAFHKHAYLWDWFFVSHGSAKFVLKDDRLTSLSHLKLDVHVLTDKSPSLLVVPPGVYHGWMSLEDDTQLVSVASDVYNNQIPDETRIPFDSFNDIHSDLWSVKGR